MRACLLIGVLTVLLAGGSAHAQEMAAPAGIQVPLLFKILTFDRRMGARPPGQFLVVAVLYQSGYRASLVAKNQVVDALEAMEHSTISGHPVRWVAVELKDREQLRLALIRERTDVVYVTPLRGVDLDLIVKTARGAGMTTFTGVPLYVQQGLALGIGIVRERPEIIINLSATRAEGSDFTAQLLRVSRVIE
jgi:uncharacterized protein DUF4154